MILSDMYIYDGGSLIKENHYQVTNSSELSYMVPIDPAKVPDISQLEGYMLCQWKKEGSDTMVSQTVNIRFLYESSLYGYVEETKLNDPVSKTGKDTVVVTYARTPSQIESVDYKYEEKLIGDHQELILDVSYDAVLKDVKYVGASPKNFYLIVHFETLGSAQYIVTDDFRDHYAECFTVDGNRVRFTLSNKYWGIPIEFPKLAYDSRTRLCGEVPFTVQGTKNENLFGEIAIVLQPDTFESDTWCKTYPLELVWGCLEGNMEVSMADGSRKKIKNIKVGDRVRCENGGQGTVTNVWSGQEEKDLMCLELSNGEKLICTESHPIAISTGYVMARTLTGMSELVSEAGESVKLTGMYPVTENEVYNLDVETDGAEGHFYASGVKVGDNKKQNDMGKIVKADNTLTQFQKEIVSLYSE